MVDRAAENAIDTLDDQLFQGWYKRGMQLVSALETGLNKIDFGTSTPEEIIQLKALIEQVKQPNMLKDRKKLLSTISEIGQKLETLHQNKDLGDLQANNFLFQASRTFNRFSKPHRLNLFLINEFFKYGKAFINPANKPSEKSEEEPLPRIADFVLKKGSKFGVKEIDGIFDFHVGSFFERQAHSMHSVKLNNLTDRATKQSSPKFLANQLGTANYARFQKTSDMTGVNDVEKLLSEKIYGFSYEFYYSQVAMYLDTLHQIEQVASMQQTPRQSQETRAALLKKYGIEAIDSPEGKHFLSSISKHLGFTDAQNLYDNYKTLAKSPEAVETLLAAKNKFCDFAVKPEGFREQDPIDLIKGIYEQEYQRIQENKKNNEFYSSNSTYISTVNYVATDFMLAIDGVRKARNIAGVAIHDELAPRVEGQNDGFLMNMAKNVANFAVNNLNLKDWVDVNQYLGLNAHGVIVEGRIEDARNQVQQQLLGLRAQQVAMRQQLREKLFNQMIGEKITQEKLIANYEEAVVSKPTAEKRDYQSAFEAKISLNCQGKNSIALEKIIDKNQRALKSVEALQSEFKKAQSVLSARKEKFERAQSSAAGRMSRFKDTIASWFGVKTQSAKKREKESQYIESQSVKIAKDIASVEARMEGYTKVLGMTKEQLTNLKRVENLDETALIKEYSDNIRQLEVLIKDLVSEYKEKPSIDYEKMLEIQSKYFVVQNKILLDKQVIVGKLPAFSLEQIEQLIASTNNLNAIQQSIKPELLGLTSTVTEFYGKKVNGYTPAIINQRHKLEEERQISLLKEHKNKVKNWVQSNDITDLKTLLVENRPKDLSESYLENYDLYLAEQVTQKISTDSHLLSLDKIASLHEMVSHLHFVSPDIQTYSDIRSELNAHLNEAYLLGTQAGFDEHRKLLMNSSESALNIFQKLEKSQEEAENLKSTYESWLMNPFGFRVEKQKLDESNAKVQTHQSILDDTLTRNLMVIQSYITDQMPIYQKKPITDLEADRDIIEQRLIQLQQISTENMSEGTVVLLDNLIEAYKGLLTNLNELHQTYFEKLLNQDEKIPMPLLSQALVQAAKDDRVDLLAKIVQRAENNIFPEIMLTQALEEAVKNQHSSVINWMLTNFDISLDEKLTSEILSKIDSSQTNITPYQKGWGQMIVDNDGYVLEKIRQAYVFQEINQSELNKQIIENKQDTVSLNVIMAKLSKIISHREQMVAQLSKVHLDNPDRIKKQVAKWNEEIENTPEGNTSTLIIEALNKINFKVEEAITQPQVLEAPEEHAPVLKTQTAVKEPEIEAPIIKTEEPKVDTPVLKTEEPINEPIVVTEQPQINFKEKYLNLKESLIEHIAKRPWEGSKFKLLLGELRDFQEDKQPDMKNDFNNTMIKLIEKLTKKSESESLEIAIDFISDPEKQKEAIHHALIHAVQLGKTDVLKALLQKEINFSENNQHLANQLMSNLVAIHAEKEQGMTQAKHRQLTNMVAQLLPLMPLSYDEKTQDLINACIKEEKNGSNYPVETGTWQRWVADNDKPFLEEYRGVYLFQEKMLKELAHDSSYDFRMPMDNLLIDKLISEFTPDEIKKYEDLADSLQQKLNTIEQRLQSFKDAQFKYLDNNQKSNIQNQDRLKNHLGNWDEQLEKVMKSQLKEIQSNINHVKKELAEYHQQHKDSVVLPDKKQVLFGYGATTEPASSKNTLDKPDKKNVSKFSPSSGQG